MVFGTFDMIHAGHEDFFRQAHSLAKDPYLIVSIARDAVARKFRDRALRHTEEERRAFVAAHPLVSMAILGDEVGYMDHISKAAPDIIALGFDQRGEYVASLERDLHDAGLTVKIVRLEPFKPEIFNTTRLRSA